MSNVNIPVVFFAADEIFSFSSSHAQPLTGISSIRSSDNILNIFLQRPLPSLHIKSVQFSSQLQRLTFNALTNLLQKMT